MKSVGQDMDQEAADELVGVERHKLIASIALGPVIFPFESDALAGEGDEPAVGNSSAVCVAGKVGEDGVGFAKRSLGIIIGPEGEDPTTIEFARLLAAEIGGFAPPPAYA
jgi:hypothetical protein